MSWSNPYFVKIGTSYDNFDFRQSEFGNSTRTLNIDSGPMSSYYVEYNIFLSVIVGHTVLFLGKGRCPLSTVSVIGCAVDDMTFATSPVNFIFIEYNDIVLKMQSFFVCSMPSNLDDDIFLHQLWHWKDAAAFKLSLNDGYGNDSTDRYIFYVVCSIILNI